MRESNRKEARAGARNRIQGKALEHEIEMEHEKTRTRWAARSIHYSLVLLGASLLLLSAMACSDQGTVKNPPSSEGAQRDPTAAASTSATAARTAPSTSTSTSPPARAGAGAQDTQPVIVFLGTSLTAGYGLPEDQAFPALIGDRVRSAGLDYRVINAGVSGDTSAGGLRRLDWLLRLPISVLVLELGANDMLRGLSIDQLRSNLQMILERTRARHPQAKFLIAGMRAAPNLGRDYAREFDAVYPDLAKRYDAALVPFLLEDVAANRRLNQADGIHPTAEGHALIAARIWPRIEEILR